MTALIVLTLRLLLGLLTLKFFIALEPVASFFLRGYQEISNQSYLEFLSIFGKPFLTFFFFAYIVLPILFDTLNKNLDKKTLITIIVKLGFLAIFSVCFNLLGLSVFIINTSWVWIGVIYAYMIVLYFSVLGELKPVLFLEEPRYFLVDLRERTSLKVFLQFLPLFVFLFIVSWYLANENAIAQAQQTLQSYRKSP